MKLFTAFENYEVKHEDWAGVSVRLRTPTPANRARFDAATLEIRQGLDDLRDEMMGYMVEHGIDPSELTSAAGVSEEGDPKEPAADAERKELTAEERAAQAELTQQSLRVGQYLARAARLEAQLDAVRVGVATLKITGLGYKDAEGNERPLTDLHEGPEEIYTEVLERVLELSGLSTPEKENLP